MDLMVKVENVNGTLVTTSNRVAEELDVSHKNLLAKIDEYIKKFNKINGSKGVAESSAYPDFYIPSEYIHPQNKQKYRNYLITEKGIAQLIGGYSAAVPIAFELNVAYINEFERMKNELNTRSAVPGSFAEALKLAYEQQLEIEEKQKQLELQAPKVAFADAVYGSKTSILIGDLAKMINQNGYDIGQKRLFKWMRDNGYLIKRMGSDYNMPTQYAMERKLFEIRESVMGADVFRTPRVTGKGQAFFINRFLKMVQ